MSWVSPGEVAQLKADIAPSGFETLATFYPDRVVDIIFSRWVNGVETTTAPQRVLIAYAEGAARTVRSESGTDVTIDGWMTKLVVAEPFNVEVDDRFSLGPVGDEQPGRIVLIQLPGFGTQKAAFRLRLGEQ